MVVGRGGGGGGGGAGGGVHVYSWDLFLWSCNCSMHLLIHFFSLPSVQRFRCSLVKGCLC